jgi:hypothetical protein
MEQDDRLRFFNVLEPFEISQEMFERLWPQVTNVWTIYSSGFPANGEEWTAYACRLLKHRRSSTRQDGVETEKRRKTKIRDTQLCSAKIRITKISVNTVRVEPFGLEPAIHTHPISDNDMLKKSQALRDLVTIEATKSYRPAEIATAVREFAAAELGVGSGVEYLRTKDVANIQQVLRGPMNAHLIGNEDLETDMTEAINFLLEDGYRVQEIASTTVKSSSSSSSSSSSARRKRGFVFATLDQLKKLTKHGWLTLMDSTHKTNKWDWRLFTLYIRDDVGSWCVGGHFFVDGEDSAIVIAALKIMRHFAQAWSPRYFLPDQSAVEANAINTVFRGLDAGEMECSVVLCTVHVMRAWMSKIYGEDVRSKMVLAMHRRTRPGCEESLQQAIDLAPTHTVRNYIMKNYVNNTEKWALYARQHSPLLLQVTTTNAVESYHSELKSTTSPSHGLIGASIKTAKLDEKKSQDAKRAALQFRTRKLSVAAVDDAILSEIHKFPYPVQRLIADEALAVLGRIEKGKEPPGLDVAECHCRFFKRYLVPCRHIFHEHIYGVAKILTAQAWQNFQEMFAEAGYEVYEHRELVEEREFETEEQRQAENLRLEMNEITERIRDAFWRTLEGGDNVRTAAFLQQIRGAIEPILHAYHP